MRTETAGPAADPSGTSPGSAPGEPAGAHASEPTTVEVEVEVEAEAEVTTGARFGDTRLLRSRRRLLVVALWPYHSVRAWILRRRKIIDLRDRGRNAAVGLAPAPPAPTPPAPTPPDGPSGPAASDAARGSGTTG
jgi:hypothetical protein